MIALVLPLLLASDGPPVAGSDAPLYWKAGMTAPRMVKDNCVGEKLTGLVPTAGDRGEALVKFVVQVDGGVGEFAVMQGADDEETARVIEAAVRSCEWVPGKDTAGKTAAQWTVVPIRYLGAEKGDAGGGDGGGTAGLTRLADVSPTNLQEAGKTPEGRAFLGQVRQDVAVKWDPTSALRARDPTGKRLPSRDRETILKITLDAGGRLVDARITKSSGLDFLDQTAIDAVAGAQPFGAPPTELLGEDGKLRFTFGFALSSGRGR